MVSSLRLMNFRCFDPSFQHAIRWAYRALRTPDCGATSCLGLWAVCAHSYVCADACNRVRSRSRVRACAGVCAGGLKSILSLSRPSQVNRNGSPYEVSSRFQTGPNEGRLSAQSRHFILPRGQRHLRLLLDILFGKPPNHHYRHRWSPSPSPPLTHTCHHADGSVRRFWYVGGFMDGHSRTECLPIPT